MGAGVTNNGILDTDATGGGGSTFVAIGQPVNVTDAAVLNVAPAGTEYGLVVRPIGGSGGGPATIADGADVTQGAIADAAVITDTTGTLSGKLRGLVKWAFERMPTSLGQKVMTASFPVVIASDQSNLNVAVVGTVPISAAALPLPALASTAALQTTGNTSLANLDVLLSTRATEATLGTRLADATFTARINTLGQKTMVNSTPVVLASDQSALTIIGTVTTGGLTDAQLRATPVPISGTISTKTDLTPAAPTFTSVGVASALAVAANANRRGLKLINTSNNIVSLGFGAAAILNSGVTLLPYGIFDMDEYDFDLGAVNAIASAAASNVAIQEYSI